VTTSDYFVPRVRVEWLVAAGRVVLAGGALVGILFDPTEPVRTSSIEAIAYLLAWYLVFGIGVLALVWSPVRFGRGWDVGLHAIDLAAFSSLIVLTNGAASPFFVTLIFLLICATMRWHLRGTLWTASAAVAAYAGASLYAAYVLDRPGFDVNTFAVRVVYLAVVTALLGYLGAHQRQFHHEIRRLAAWPRSVSRDRNDVLVEILSHAADVLGAPRVVLLWEDPDDGQVNVASLAGGALTWTREPESAFGSIVAPPFEGRSFQSNDVNDARARVVSLTPRGFLRRRCRPVDERLRARFEMRAVQSWPLEGDVVRGRLFCLDIVKSRLDDLSLGGFVARLAGSRLDNLYLLSRLREAAALEERVRLARHLHDGLLQSQAGAALQLLAARRVLDRDPAAGMRRLADVQQQLEDGELEMRSVICGLRPAMSCAPGAIRPGLRDRLAELRQRVERQWEVTLALNADGSIQRIPEALAEHVYRLVQEAVVNAARHADASRVAVDLAVIDSLVRLVVTDDGKGFPFAGTYDLAALRDLDRGPVTLKERVVELRGNLRLTSAADSGSELLITVPLAHA
jgi:signal transduction histidine kinase